MTRTRRVPLEPAGGVRERPPVLATAVSGQAKHNHVYSRASNAGGAIWDRLTLVATETTWWFRLLDGRFGRARNALTANPLVV